LGADETRPANRPSWGEPPPGIVRRLIDRARAALADPSSRSAPIRGELPLALRRTELAPEYIAAESRDDHVAAATTAEAAAERAITAEEWWAADTWAQRALWHYEQVDMTIDAVRVARRIGDLRTAAGDPDSARRYYAEAIDEARDIGAEHEQGLAAIGLGRAHLDLGDVSAARRLAGAAIDLLERSGAPAAELASARALIGSEVAVGEGSTEEA
jgi:tetratricopeptide (TPR) repeat protein